VSYSDEGVFGNFGWGGSGRSRPIGASGLVQFGPDGAIQREWVCYHTDFPLVRVGPNATRAWSTGVTGVRAVAIHRDRVLLAGCYDDQAGRALLGRLGDDAVEDLVPAEIELPGGRQWERMRCTGRGSVLYLYGDGTWFAVDLRQSVD
jgi:hypothetical protein